MLKKRKIYFRADAGPEIGYGHYIRSLALADMLKRDFDCTMFTQSPTNYQLREAEEVCPVVALPADNTKFDKFIDYLSGDEIVVLDNYFFTTDYQGQIKAKGCKLVCIDDMHDKHYVADVVINHGVDDAGLFDVESYTRLCLGYPYALLRKPFLDTQVTSIHNEGVYVVCFGGSDPYNLTKKYIDLLINSQLPKRIYAVVGDGYQYLETLKKYSTVEVLSNLTATQMADLFRSAEAVVCSASTTAFEALACGCKVYAGWYVDNQVGFYNQLCDYNAIVPLAGLLDNHLLIEKSYETDKISFTASGHNLRNVFWRFVLREVNYQSLTEDESRQVWQTRNLPQIRKWMLNPEPFSREEHLEFVAGLKQREDKLYIAFFDRGQLVASYDLVDIHDGSAVCGLFLHPDYEGLGIASLVEDIMEEKARKKAINQFVSQVMNSNVASLAFFTRNKFRQTAKDAQFTYFIKQI